MVNKPLPSPNDSVLLITSDNPQNSRFGTGFVFHRDDSYSYVLTCLHVVSDVGGKDHIKIGDEKAELVAAGSEQELEDVAVLKIKLQKNALPLVLSPKGRPDLGFITIGFQSFEKDHFILRSLSGNLYQQVGLESRGYSSRICAWELKFLDDCELQPGYSGSPVIDDSSGDVIGIVSHRQGTRKGIAISVEVIAGLSEWNTLLERESAKKANVEPASISTSQQPIKITTTPENFTMFYGDKKHIGLIELERIYQASILLADKIYIDAGVTPDPRLDNDTRKMILRKLLDLYDIGALKVWGYEDFYLPQLSKDSLGLQVAKQKCEILDGDTYRKIYDSLNHKALSDVNIFYRLAPRGQTDPVQGVTEIVEGRRNLWSIAVASHFNADRILTDDNKTISLQNHLSKFLRYSVLERPILEKFLDTLNIGPMARLNTSEIEECRKYTLSFREKFLSRSGKASLEIQDESEVTTSIAEQLIQEYTEQLEAAALKSSPWNQIHKTTTTLLLNLLGYFSPQSLFGDLSHLLLEWGITRSNTFPLFLIVKLREFDKKDR